MVGRAGWFRVYVGFAAVTFGPAWNPVLVVLAVLAVLCGLAMLHWWLGVMGLALALTALGFYFGLQGW